MGPVVMFVQPVTPSNLNCSNKLKLRSKKQMSSQCKQ